MVAITEELRELVAEFRALIRRKQVEGEEEVTMVVTEGGGPEDLRLFGQSLERFVGRENHEFDFSAVSLKFHLFHHRRRPISAGANDETWAIPR